MQKRFPLCQNVNKESQSIKSHLTFDFHNGSMDVEREVPSDNIQVVDGTSCDDEGRRICVDGECMPVGCDGNLGSNTEVKLSQLEL